MPDIGLTFSPTQGGNQYGQNGQRSGAGSNPVMDAIKILSFRVPTVLGANAPVAGSLLAGPGGAMGSGLDNTAMIQNWLSRMFGQGAVNRSVGQFAPGFNPPSGVPNTSIVYDVPPTGGTSPVPGTGTYAPAAYDPNALPAGSSLPQANAMPADSALPQAGTLGAMGAGSALPQATPYDRSASQPRSQPPPQPMPAGYFNSPTEGYTPQGPSVPDFGAGRFSGYGGFGGGRFGG